MPLPHRKPVPGEAACAAFLEVRYVPAARTYYAGLLLLDDHGRPLEFAHNTLTLPDTALWSPAAARLPAVAELARSLFDAVRREPDLLLCLASLGEPADLLRELAPAVPFGQVDPGEPPEPAAWCWVNDPPTAEMGAARVHRALVRRGLLVEPFARLHAALAECYANVPWDEPDGPA